MTDTLAALETAVQNHIGTLYEGSLVDGWILVCHAQTVEQHDMSNYRIITPETQPHHVDAGLVHVGGAIIKDSWDAALTDGDDDE